MKEPVLPISLLCFPWYSFFPKSGCLHKSKNATVQALIRTLHRLEEKNVSFGGSERMWKFLFQKSLQNFPCVSLALKWILCPFPQQGLTRAMPKLTDLGLDHGIHFKNRKMALPWLVWAVSFYPWEWGCTSSSMSYYSCLFCVSIEPGREFLRSGPLTYFSPSFQITVHLLSHHSHSKCLFNMNKIAVFQYMLLSLFPSINSDNHSLGTCFIPLHGGPWE